MAEQKKGGEFKELPTPISLFWDRALYVGIVGVLDFKRAQEIMKAVLNMIVEKEVKVVVVDISGVPFLDSAVAAHLSKILKAVDFMGCVPIMTGVSPATAQTMVALGLEKTYTSCVTLKDAFEEAFRILGLEVRPMERG